MMVRENGLPSISEGRSQFTFTKSSNASSSSDTLVLPGGDRGRGAMTAEEAMKICNTSLEHLLKSGFWPKKRGWSTNERVGFAEDSDYFIY